RAYARRRSAPFVFARERRDRIRIGYLSPHFHEHATTHLIAGVLECHDRRRFEITGFSALRAPSRTEPSRAVAEFERHAELSALATEEAARAIHECGIDILVDGMGYTRGARTGILALRPAPVQAGYLVYPGTSGGTFLDYYIADRYVLPPEQAGTFTERI